MFILVSPDVIQVYGNMGDLVDLHTSTSASAQNCMNRVLNFKNKLGHECLIHFRWA